MSKFAALFGSIVLVRILTKDEYGLLSYVENLYGYTALFIGFGLINTLFRYVVLAHSKKEESSVLKYVITRGSLFNVSLAAVLICIAMIWPYQQEFSYAHLLLPLALLALPFQFVCEAGNSFLRALFENKKFAIASCCIAVVLISGKLLFAFFGGVTTAVLAPLVVYTSASVFFIVYLRKRGYLGAKNKITISRPKRRDMNIYALQNMITDAVWAVFTLNDILFLGLFLGETSVLANYRVASILPAAMTLVTTSAGMFIGPYFIKNEQNKAWIWRNYRKVMCVNLAMLCCIALVLMLLGTPIVTFLYGSEYLDALPIMSLLIVVSLINGGFRYLTAHLFAVLGYIKINMIISLIGLAIQVIAAVLLIPVFGVFGAIASNALAQGIMAAILIFNFVKTYRCFMLT